MRVEVGPVATASAEAWIARADEVFGEVRDHPSSGPHLLFGAGGFLERWKGVDHGPGGSFRWHANVDPEELEYLVHECLHFDEQLARESEFYVVLVRDLLHALEMEGGGHAEFVDQLRCCWPSAAEAG